MSIITSDIKISGKHARICEFFVENKIYSNNYEVFIRGALIGLYHGKKSEYFNDGNHSVSVGRVNWGTDLEKILFTFLQQEKYYQGDAIKTIDVFTFEEKKDNKQLIDELIRYALFGIEIMGEDWADFISNTSSDSIIERLSELERLNKTAIKNKVHEDENGFFAKRIDDQNISEKLNLIKEINT